MATVNIAPDREGMQHWLRQVARDRDDARVLWGFRMAQACGDGWLDWYLGEVGEARGWQD